jgi:nucleotide-binding universal stress UspA family protein
MTRPSARAAATIVVGVDGSPASAEATEWAAHEAALRGAQLVIVHVYNPLPAGLLAAPMPQAVFEDVRAIAQALVARCATSITVAVPTTARVVPGAPGPELEQASADADLLVVGASAHHNAAVRLALGSVAQHCVNNAHCPVVVVPVPPRLAAHRDEDLHALALA